MNRRSFLKLMSSGAVALQFNESIARALSIPARVRTGTIADVEHVVFLMQENRAFDHYLGTLNGVRGFGDPRAVKIGKERTVFQQPVGARGGEEFLMPFHPTAANLGLQFIKGTAHDWASTHHARNDGYWDRWVPAKTPLTMAHLTRADIPYHYALADAFTICDAYHTSLLGPTDPNRSHMFSGWVGNDGSHGGPMVDNDETGEYSWMTFPEVLEQAGISWRLYQDIGEGIDAAGNWGQSAKNKYTGNYGDNALLYFKQYREAAVGSGLHQRAMTGTSVAQGGAKGSLFDHIEKDCMAGTLPQVSWICAPEAFSEHPDWPPNFGAYYVSRVLNALTANPEIWSRTALFVMYDENDGFFDHVVPPAPPVDAAHGQSTVETMNEIYEGGADSRGHKFVAGPYGLGPRVPMFVISPWSKGGWVSSEVFDHTSMIRFVQARFGTKNAPLEPTNITPWRHAVCGDLTSAFNFADPNRAEVKLPSTIGYVPLDELHHATYAPVPPSEQKMPVQEEGTRPARAVPYRLNADAVVDFAGKKVRLSLENSGMRAAVFHVREGVGREVPRSHTVGAGGRIADEWNFAEEFALGIYGPNGFFREYCGGAAATNIEARVEYDYRANGVKLIVKNAGNAAVELEVKDGYNGEISKYRIGKGKSTHRGVLLAKNAGWYDFVLTAEADAQFRQQLAGHVETGKDSTTDPAISGATT